MSEVSKIALGTVQFGLNYGIGNTVGKTSSEEITQILTVCRQSGIEVLDTASLYGDSELELGKQELVGFRVVSKFPEVESASQLDHYFQSSLSRLGLNNLYGYLAHRPNNLLATPVLWDRLVKYRREGRVQKIGYSLYHPNELKELLKFGFYPDLVQVPFNFLDRRFEEDLKILHSKGGEVHVRSAFLQGLFFQSGDKLPTFFDPLKKWLSDLNSQMPEYGLRAAALLKFCFEKPFIDKVVMGVNTSQHLLENLNNLEKTELTELPQFDSLNELPGAILNPSEWPK